MALFRKRETYNEQMLREAGLDRVRFNEPRPAEPAPPPRGTDPSVRSDLGRIVPRAWDATATTTAPGITGDQVRFTVLPDGDLIVEEDTGDSDLAPLADAVEEHVSPPYKAVASRQHGDLWGIGATEIEVATLVFPDADALELSQSDGVAELRVDGEPSDTVAPVELQRLGERVGADFCVEASRIDGDYWEVKVSAL